MKEELTYDFSCWVLLYNGATIYGQIYEKDSLKDIGCVVVPLLWNHQQTVLGTAILEHRDGEGVYAYCTLYDTSDKNIVINLISDKGTVSSSPYIKIINRSGNIITDGIIQEVSLVPARIDPDERYYPILREE